MMSLTAASIVLFIEPIGIAALGIVIGILVAVFLRKNSEFTLAGLSGLIAILAGSGVIAIFNFLGHDPTLPRSIYWLYPIGLCLGFIPAYRGFRRRYEI